MVWTFRKILDILTGIAALAAVLLCTFLALNSLFGFGLGVNLQAQLLVIQNWLLLAIMLLAGLRFCTGKGVILFVVYLLLAAVVVLWVGFPETFQSLAELIGGGK